MPATAHVSEKKLVRMVEMRGVSSEFTNSKRSVQSTVLKYLAHADLRSSNFSSQSQKIPGRHSKICSTRPKSSISLSEYHIKL